MEWLRRMFFVFLGFVAAVSVAVADDRMVVNYGCHSVLDVNVQVREAAAQMDVVVTEAEKLGEFYVEYFQHLIALSREGNKEKFHPEAFSTQKL